MSSDEYFSGMHVNITFNEYSLNKILEADRFAASIFDNKEVKVSSIVIPFVGGLEMYEYLPEDLEESVSEWNDLKPLDDYNFGDQEIIRLEFKEVVIFPLNIYIRSHGKYVGTVVEVGPFTVKELVTEFKRINNG